MGKSEVASVEVAGRSDVDGGGGEGDLMFGLIVRGTLTWPDASTGNPGKGNLVRLSSCVGWSIERCDGTAEGKNDKVGSRAF
jgi:hypothetical protein